MSIILGIRAPSDVVVEREQVLRLADATERFTPDRGEPLISGRIGMYYQPFRTHPRSLLERQPFKSVENNLLVFDGRLDNHDELCDALGLRDEECPDSTIVTTAFERWKAGCFSKFVGEWALAFWSNREQVLYLARDHAGTRTLYFRADRDSIWWSTYLETFIADGSTLSLDETYVARYLCMNSVGDLTPYRGIRAVPPAHYVEISKDRVRTSLYWDCWRGDRITYGDERQYDEHFLSLFAKAVQRRTSRGEKVLAHLSGGMDSTSIVCMSDQLRASQGDALIDTVSFYDSSEPNWNEYPFFTEVERFRGKSGIHLTSSFTERTFDPADSSLKLYLLPGADSATFELERKFDAAVSQLGARAIVTGFGGDEVLGGAPNPLPELADLLVAGNFRLLWRNAISWCREARSPLAELLLRTLRFCADIYLHTSVVRVPPWISPGVKRISESGITFEKSIERRVGLVPSQIHRSQVWWSTLESLPHLNPSALTRYEHRYPYLDRDLVDFLARIPCAQIARPGRRRMLMRRALKGVVPDAILERRRKAFLMRGPLVCLQRSRHAIETMLSSSLAVRHGLIEPKVLAIEWGRVIEGTNVEGLLGLYRTLTFELWLRAREGKLAGEPASRGPFDILKRPTKLPRV